MKNRQQEKTLINPYFLMRHADYFGGLPWKLCKSHVAFATICGRSRCTGQSITLPKQMYCQFTDPEGMWVLVGQRDVRTKEHDSKCTRQPRIHSCVLLMSIYFGIENENGYRPSPEMCVFISKMLRFHYQVSVIWCFNTRLCEAWLIDGKPHYFYPYPLLSGNRFNWFGHSTWVERKWLKSKWSEHVHRNLLLFGGHLLGVELRIVESGRISLRNLMCVIKAG